MWKMNFPLAIFISTKTKTKHNPNKHDTHSLVKY